MSIKGPEQLIQLWASGKLVAPHSSQYLRSLSLAPHLLQKLVPSGLLKPQAMQEVSFLLPQNLQKRLLSDKGLLHFGHNIVKAFQIYLSAFKKLIICF
jgi:hypothetical protein